MKDQFMPSFCFLLLVLLHGCSPKLVSKVDQPVETVPARYRVVRDVAYGLDGQQTMDIYLANDARRLGNKNFTVVFLHGGGYYISDKTKEERYITPYLKKGMNVVNMNYRLKKGIPVATEDLTYALNYLLANNTSYGLNLQQVILTGFSAGAHIASIVAATANDSTYANKLAPGISISGVINFSGPVARLDVVEKVFMDHQVPLMKEIGNALFTTNDGYAPADTVRKYEPLTYFDKTDPPFFVWYGGKDDQVPPVTFEKFVQKLNEDKRKNKVVFVPDGAHSPTTAELDAAYRQIFAFLDRL